MSSFDTGALTETEVLLGADESHLDFRASVLVSGTAVTVSTVACVHNRRGRLYLMFVRLGHPLVVRAMLARANRRLSARAAAEQPTAHLTP